MISQYQSLLWPQSHRPRGRALRLHIPLKWCLGVSGYCVKLVTKRVLDQKLVIDLGTIRLLQMPLVCIEDTDRSADTC